MPNLELTIVVPDTGATYAAQFDCRIGAERAIAAIAGFHSGDTVSAVLSYMAHPTLDAYGYLVTGFCVIQTFAGNADNAARFENWTTRQIVLA